MFKYIVNRGLALAKWSHGVQGRSPERFLRQFQVLESWESEVGDSSRFLSGGGKPDLHDRCTIVVRGLRMSKSRIPGSKVSF